MMVKSTQMKSISVKLISAAKHLLNQNLENKVWLRCSAAVDLTGFHTLRLGSKCFESVRFFCF